MIDSKLRQTYQFLIINPLMRLPLLSKVHPTQLTLTGLCFGLMIPLFLFFEKPLYAGICLGLTGFFDTLDGTLARALKKTSNRGAALDITSDRIVEFAIILGLYFVDPSQRAFASLLMIGSTLICVTTFLVVGIFSQNETEKSFFYSPGLIERTEAFGFFLFMIALPHYFLLLASLYVILVLMTGGIRLYQFIIRESNIRSEIIDPK